MYKAFTSTVSVVGVVVCEGDSCDECANGDCLVQRGSGRREDWTVCCGSIVIEVQHLHTHCHCRHQSPVRHLHVIR